jgi:hypothetical protein
LHRLQRPSFHLQAIRSRRLPQDGKLAALSHLARTLIENRGRLDDQESLVDHN